jgi:hypothetical protein
VTPEFESLTIEISLPANRDFTGSLTVWSDQERVVGGPFQIAARASDEIAAEHGNPARIPTLPYGDPPAGTYRYGGKVATGAGSRLRQDLFGPKDVIVLLPTGGPAALGDANGRFEIFIHGGPPAANGGLRVTSGHFRISDADLDRLGDILERAARVTCVCVVTAMVGRAIVAGLGPPGQATAKPGRPRRRPKPLVPYEALVAFGEYSAGNISPDPVTDTSLSSPTLGPAGQQGLAQFGILTICASMQESADLATVTDINAYTCAPVNFNPAADNSFTSWLTPFYPEGQSPLYPNGQNVNSYNGPPGGIPDAGPAPQPGSANLLSALAPGVASGNAAASLPSPNLPSASLTSAGTASPFGNGANPFLPGSLPRLESANAWASAGPSAAAEPYIQQAVQYGFGSPSWGAPGANISTATAQTTQSITTSIRAQIAEITGYEARLANNGEIGIIAPSGSNVPGLDYFTVTPLPGGGYAFNIVDMKSRVSQNAFGQVSGSMPGSWLSTADRGIAQLDLGNPQLEQDIQNAWAASRATATPTRDTMDFGPQAESVTALPGGGYTGGLTVGGTPVALDQPPAGPAPTMPLGGQLLSGGLGLAGAGISGFALQNDIANGRWLAAGVDAASFVSSSLIAGGTAAGSQGATLLQVGQTLGVVLAPVTAVSSGYAFGNDVASGQWLASTADASSLSASLLTFGGWLVGSAALASAGAVIGTAAAAWGVGTLINNYLLPPSVQNAIGYWETSALLSYREAQPLISAQGDVLPYSQ